VSGPIPLHPDDEELAATSMSRDLEALAAETGIRPPVGFADRVMAAIAVEPLPQPARAFGAALLAGRFRAAVASVGDAWRVVVGKSAPLAVRGQALALVLVVAVASLGVAGGAAVGAMDLLSADQTPAPSPTTPLPSQGTPSPDSSRPPAIVPDESASPEPTETPEPSETPRPTQRPGGGTAQPTPTDDHGGGSGGGDGDDSGHDSSSSGSGSGGDSHSETPKPEETEEPTIGDSGDSSHD
jgi:uncharacterized membrane protein YgcG